MKSMWTFVLAIGLFLSGASVSGAKAAIVNASFGLPGQQLDAQASVILVAEGSQDKHRDKERAGKERNWEKRHEHMLERLERLPPEQQEEARQRIEEMRVKREKIRAELEALPPEERKARMNELRREYRENRKAHGESFKQEFQKRWEDASPEKRSAFCDQAVERCNQGREKACDFVSDVCGE